MHQKSHPVCKFGPGGDFVWRWPRQGSLNLMHYGGRLNRIIALLDEMVKIMLGSQLESFGSAQIDKAATVAEAIHRLGGSQFADETDESGRPVFTPAIAVVRNGRRVLQQPMLFADNYSKVRRKSKIRNRSYQKSAKKKVSCDRPGQGSLFETNLRGARIA